MTHLVICESNSGAYEVRIEGESARLNLDQLSVLFGRDRSVIGKHIRKIFSEGELEKTSVWANFAHTAEDGKTYQKKKKKNGKKKLFLLLKIRQKNHNQKNKKKKLKKDLKIAFISQMV